MGHESSVERRKKLREEVGALRRRIALLEDILAHLDDHLLIGATIPTRT